MKKRNKKGKISGYSEFIAIKRELRKSISKQEESFNNDILSVDSIYNTTMNLLTRRNNNEKVFDNSNTLMLNDLIIQIAKPYLKNEKQKQVFLPAISLGISIFVTNILNNRFRRK